MKRLSRHVLWAALLAAVCPGAIRAQSAGPYYYAGIAGYQEAQEGAAEAAPPAADANYGAGQGCCDSCGGCGGGLFSHGLFGGCGCGLCWPCGCKLEDLGEACKLWKPCCEESQWSANGWLTQSYVWNPYRPNDKFNGPVTWTDRANEYQMTELWYGFGRTTKTDGCCWDFGGRFDIFYGTNYRWDTSAGFESHWGNGQFYGAAVPNAYLEAAYNTWTARFGRFVSPVGYYTVGTANNFFPVIPYTYQYGEPFTHTGIWVNNKLSDQWTVGGGITHGWDDTDNTGNPHAGGLLNATYTIDEQRSLAWVGVLGNEPNLSGVNFYAPNGVGYTGRYFQTLVYTRKFSDDVMGVLQSDFGTQHDAVIDPNGNLRTAKWYGLNGYLYWNMTCRCQWGLNGEWFRDQGGFRVGQVLPSFGSPHARGLARSGFDGSFYRITFGPRYYFTPNVYTRVAALFDWYEGKENNAGSLRPFDDGQRNHQQIVVFDLVGTF
jgi:Putative beta-barrel porin-2, OmpL-like. bbp2